MPPARSAGPECPAGRSLLNQTGGFRERLDDCSQIRRLRREAGWTQEQLAERADHSPSCLSHVERGPRRSASVLWSGLPRHWMCRWPRCWTGRPLMTLFFHLRFYPVFPARNSESSLRFPKPYCAACGKSGSSPPKTSFAPCGYRRGRLYISAESSLERKQVLHSCPFQTRCIKPP